MAGQAIVVIKGRKWGVAIANTYAELVSGLSGMQSLPPQTGMLFDLGYDQKYIAINMSQMLFPLDIVFINSTQGVVGVLENVPPGQDAYLNNQALPGARCFLEVNAGEAVGIAVGDNVDIQGYVQAAQVDWIGLLTLIGTAVPVVTGIVKTAGKMLGASREKSKEGLPQTVRRYPTESDRAELINLYHLARVAGKESRYDRMLWAVDQFVKKHPEWTKASAYKAIDEALQHPEILPQIEPKSKVYFIGGCKVSDGKCLTHGYPAGETTRCTKSPLTGEEWKSAWALVQSAFPQGQHNPWVDGWWPKSREEAETTVKTYADSLRRAFQNYEFMAREAIDRYRRSAEKAIYYYREYVMREYEKGKEMASKKLVTAPALTPTKPTERKPGKLEYLADSPEFLTQTIEDIGYREKLDTAFQQAIARAKGMK